MHASVIILCFNGLVEATRPCVESLYRNTPSSEFELIAVDNASTDGTPEFLRQLERTHHNVRVQLNDVNKGYAGGNNDGLRLASGEYLILLNNDTLVPPGWLNRLLHLLETNRNIGMVGPVTNSVGNEQRIELPTLCERNFEEISAQYTERQREVWFSTEKLGFFCVAMRRELPQRAGYLDENFGIGMFEDDDFCLRVRSGLGYTLAVAEDCFVYHKGSVSFDKLAVDSYRTLFEKNRHYFESKHGVSWSYTDLAFSYWEKFNRDLSAYSQAGLVDPNIERIMVRFENLRHLLLQIHEVELVQQPSRQSGSCSLMKRHRWYARWHNIKVELLLGSWLRKKNYLRRIKERVLTKILGVGSSARSAIRELEKIRTDTNFQKAVIFPATIDFGFMIQRPQQLAKAFAKQGILVIYGTLNHGHDKVAIAQCIEPHLYLVHEQWFPFLHYAIKSEETLFFCLWPNNVKHLGHLPYSRVVYDWMDDLRLLDLSPESVERDHAAMLHHADVITVSSEKLHNAIPRQMKLKTILLNNAVSEEFIEAVQMPTPVPSELQDLGERRILGYYGAVAEWLDFDLLGEVASSFSADCAIVLVGPVFGNRDKLNALLEKNSNVYYFKERAIEELIPFLQRFDVCLIPFCKNEITDAISPVKLFEYLAAGKPVVTTDIAECRKYEGVSCARTEPEFMAFIKEALQEQTEVECQDRLTVAQCNTWEGRVRTLQEKLDALSACDTYSGPTRAEAVLDGGEEPKVGYLSF